MMIVMRTMMVMVRALQSILTLTMTKVGSLEKFGQSGRTVELLEVAASLLGEQHLLLHIIK